MVARPPVTAYIGVGANLGSRAETIAAALGRLDACVGVRVVRRSRLIETEAVGGPPDQPRYLNGAAAVETTLTARVLLARMLGIERALGRDRAREERFGPRAIDLDLLLYGDQVIREEGLVVPHARMHERWFVLQPMSEIAGEVLHPVLGERIDVLAARVRPPAGARRGAGGGAGRGEMG